MAGWSKKIIANLIDPEETRIAITDERGKLCDFFIERMLEHQRTGEIYKARVDSVLPGMNSAFLNLGDGRNGFLYLDDVKGKEVRPGMDMLVQVVKNARKGKGARVSPRISLAGRYMVLIPGGHETGVSKRIASDEERARLRSVAKEIRPKGFGIIIRTVAENCDIESLRGDVENLVAQWGEIEHRMKQNSAPCLIHKDIGLLERVLRDELTDEVDEIVIDSEDERENIEAVVKKFFHENVPEVNVCTARTPLFELYGLENQIEELQDRKVWLNSGAYLVIDQTEALTVIDVNTGKFIGSKNLNDTVLKTNLEAAVEIARQLRLRALGGIVVHRGVDRVVLLFQPVDHAEAFTAVFRIVGGKAEIDCAVFLLKKIGLIRLRVLCLFAVAGPCGFVVLHKVVDRRSVSGVAEECVEGLLFQLVFLHRAVDKGIAQIVEHCDVFLPCGIRRGAEGGVCAIRKAIRKAGRFI